MVMSQFLCQIGPALEMSFQIEHDGSHDSSVPIQAHRMIALATHSWKEGHMSTCRQRQ